MLNKYSNKVAVLYIALYISLIISNYILPDILNWFILTAILVVFIFSKNSYFWFALFFLIESFAGSFFSYASKYPMIGALPFSVPLTFAVLIKYFHSRQKQRVFYLSIFIVLILYYFLQRFTTDIDLKVILKRELPIVYVIVLPTFLNTYDAIRDFFKLVFVGQFIVFFGQWYQIVMQKSIALTLFTASGKGRIINIIDSDFGGLVRSIDGVFLSYLSLIGSLFLLSVEKKNKYYQVMAIISFLSIWITATRGWILASIVILIPYFLKLHRKRMTNILFILTLVFAITRVGIVKRQITMVFARLQTVESVIEGDLTAGGTLVRLTDRHIPVWNKFLESPVIGWGFSNTFDSYADVHVGNQTLLLNVGLVGFMLFSILILIYCKGLISTQKRFRALVSSSTVLLVAIAGIVVIHSTSRQMIGYSLVFIVHLLNAAIFTVANYIYYNSVYLNDMIANE